MKPVVLMLVMVGGLLSGCSWFGADDNSEPPAKLASFDRQVDLKKVWSRSTGKGTDEQFIKLVPTVAGERVYVADRSGTVSAVELETGKVVWQKKTDIAISAGTGVGEGLALVGSSEGDLVALDMESGEIRWRTEVSSEVLSVPQVYEGVVIVQTVDGNLAGWEAAVAIPHGRTELQRIVDLDADPVVRLGVLYVASYQGRLVAINLQDGHVLWNREMSSYAGLDVDSHQVYVSDTDSEVWALDRRSGGSLWKQGALRRRALTGPVIIGDYVGVGDFEGYLHLLTRLDGSIAGRVRVDSDGIAATPIAIFGDRLLVLGAGGTLALYQLEPA
jgi:outer membrane protein assembly factor BamB